MLHLSPHQRGRTVEYIVGNFVTTVGRQAVQQHGLATGGGHQGLVDLEGPEVRTALSRLVLKTHRDPGVGVDRVNARHSSRRRIKEAQGAATRNGLGVFHVTCDELVPRRRADIDVDTKP